MDEIKTDNKHIKVAGKLSSLPRKHISANRRKNYRPLLLPQQFLNGLNHMLTTSIKDAPNFIRILISSMKNLI